MACLSVYALLLLGVLQISTVTPVKEIERSGWSKSSYSIIYLKHVWTIATIAHLYHGVESDEISALGTSVQAAKWTLSFSTYDECCYHYYSKCELKVTSLGSLSDVRVVVKIIVRDLDGKVIASFGDLKSVVFKKEGEVATYSSTDLRKAIEAGMANDTLVVDISLKIGSDFKTVGTGSENSLQRNFDVPVCDFDKEASALIIQDLKYSNTFFTIDSELIPVPKVLLASKSAQFDRLFDEARKTDDKPLKIPLNDTDKETMTFVLRFAYTGEGVIPEGLEKRLLIAANKYGLETLKIFTQNAISKKVTMQNALEMLDLADEYKADQLKEYIADYIRMNSLDMSLQDWSAMVHNMTTKQCELVSQKTCE